MFSNEQFLKWQLSSILKTTTYKNNAYKKAPKQIALGLK